MSNRMKQACLISLSLLALFPGAGQTQDTSSAAAAYTDVDTRRPIITRPNERAHILQNMRRYLTGLQAVTEALSRDDMPAATEAARSMGSINLYEVHLMFPNAAAIEFRDLGGELHREFDRIAKDAQERKNAKAMMAQIGAAMKKCVYCHETYALRDTAH